MGCFAQKRDFWPRQAGAKEGSVAVLNQRIRLEFSAEVGEGFLRGKPERAFPDLLHRLHRVVAKKITRRAETNAGVKARSDRVLGEGKIPHGHLALIQFRAQRNDVFLELFLVGIGTRPLVAENDVLLAGELKQNPLVEYRLLIERIHAAKGGRNGEAGINKFHSDNRAEFSANAKGDARRLSWRAGFYRSLTNQPASTL